MTYCRHCTNDVMHPCPSPEHADQCDGTGSLRAGRPAPLQGMTFSLNGVELEGVTDAEITLDDGRTIRTTRANLLGTVPEEIELTPEAMSRTDVAAFFGIQPEGVVVIEWDMARATAEQAERSADMERQLATLSEFWTGRAEPAPNYRQCGMCGEQVTNPCGSLNSARGCMLPGQVYRERFARTVPNLENARAMPPAVRQFARGTSQRAELVISELERLEERAASAVLPWCELCGSHVARPCTTLVAAGGCDMPRRFLEASGWHGGGVSGRDFPPAVRALCGTIQLQQGQAPVAMGAGAQAFTVCGPDGVLDVNSVTTVPHTTMVTFLVSMRGYDAQAIVNDVEACRDAWNNGPLLEGFSVVRVEVALAGNPQFDPGWRPMSDAPPPPQEARPRRRAIRA